MVVHVGYSNSYVFPYEDGIKFLSALKSAETYNNSDYDHHRIEPINDRFEVDIIDEDRYVELKINHILGVPANESR